MSPSFSLILFNIFRSWYAYLFALHFAYTLLQCPFPPSTKFFCNNIQYIFQILFIIFYLLSSFNFILHLPLNNVSNH